MEAIIHNLNKEVLLKYKIERVSRLFTKREIAVFAGVSIEDLHRFEKGEPLEQSVIRKLTDAYHTLDATGLRISSPYR